MPINPSLLIAAPMLQDYLVDKDTGLPLSNGTITMYQDNSRTTLKNWYYQVGTPGNYNYITLPNPMTLSAVGTTMDGNNNDIIPYYYPYDENSEMPIAQPYYVVVKDSGGEVQFTRENFPFNPNGVSPADTVPTNNNLIVNNVFWRNIGSLNASVLPGSIEINGDTLYFATIVPSQHDGYLMSDIQYYKDENNGTDAINFYQFVPPASNPTFADQILEGDITPEFYLNVQCTGAGTETRKYVQIPLSLHVKSLSGYPSLNFTVQAMAVPGSSNGEITIGLFQFLGSGVLSPTVIPEETIILGNSWEKYVINIPIPSAANLTLGNGGDDALYIQIGYPTATTFNINIAVPSAYLSSDIPTDSFQTYDEVNAIISSPRTGDVKLSINAYYPGYIPMNDGTIGSAFSNANNRANSDTWLLFDYLWGISKPFDTGANFNPICQMYTSGASPTNFSSSAIGDFNLNNQLALTKMFGRVLMGTVPIEVLRPVQKQTFNGTDSGGNLLITTTADVNFFLGMPISFVGGSLPGGLVQNNIYYVAGWNPTLSTNTFFVATTYDNALNYVFVPYASNGSGTVVGGNTGAITGEYQHYQLLNEIREHTHDDPGNLFITGGGAAVYQGAANQGQTSAVTGGITGYTGLVPFNITQPSTFMNVFMKM